MGGYRSGQSRSPFGVHVAIRARPSERPEFDPLRPDGHIEQACALCGCCRLSTHLGTRRVSREEYNVVRSLPTKVRYALARDSLVRDRVPIHGGNA